MKSKKILITLILPFSFNVLADNSYLLLDQSGGDNNITVESLGNSNTLMIEQQDIKSDVDIFVNGNDNNITSVLKDNDILILGVNITGSNNNATIDQLQNIQTVLQTNIENNSNFNTIALIQSKNTDSSINLLVDGSYNMV